MLYADGVEGDIVGTAHADAPGVEIVGAVLVEVLPAIAIGIVELAVTIDIGHQPFRIADTVEIEEVLLGDRVGRFGRDDIDLCLERVLDPLLER